MGSGLSGSCGSGEAALRYVPPVEDRPSTQQEFNKVKRKLREAFPDLNEEGIDDLAARLSNRKNLIQHHFPHLLKRGSAALDTVYDEARTYGDRGFRNKTERDESATRLLADRAEVEKVEVSLQLYELKGDNRQKVAKAFGRLIPKGNFDYGPYHAAVKIGDVIIDWNADGLIIPHTANIQPESELQQQQSEASAAPSVAKLKLQASTESHGTHRPKTQVSETPIWAQPGETMQAYISEVDFVVDLITQKELLIHQLADVVVTYNTKYNYNILTNNCQHFVTEILKAIGGSQHVQQLQENIQQINEVMGRLHDNGARSADFELATHQELDEYIRANMETLSKEDIELCHSRYVLFHVFHEADPTKRAWHCNTDTCQHKLIEAKL